VLSHVATPSLLVVIVVVVPSPIAAAAAGGGRRVVVEGGLQGGDAWLPCGGCILVRSGEHPHPQTPSSGRGIEGRRRSTAAAQDDVRPGSVDDGRAVVVVVVVSILRIVARGPGRVAIVGVVGGEGRKGRAAVVDGGR
jgi:hypothetical protein